MYLNHVIPQTRCFGWFAQLRKILWLSFMPEKDDQWHCFLQTKRDKVRKKDEKISLICISERAAQQSGKNDFTINRGLLFTVLPAKVMLVNLIYLNFFAYYYYDRMYHFIKCTLHETYFCIYVQQEQVLDALFW